MRDQLQQVYFPVEGEERARPAEDWPAVVVRLWPDGDNVPWSWPLT
jgi:hypothetical protein